MSEYYTHTLIPKQKDFVPTADQVQEFLTEMVASGVVPGPTTPILFTPSKRTRSGVNPFTGEIVVFPMKDCTDIASLAEIGTIVNGLGDYEVEVSNLGTPSMPALPIAVNDSYSVTVRCRVSPTCRSTCSLSDEFANESAVPYGEECPPTATMGVFTNPHDGSVIHVQDAGNARF